MAVLLAGIIPLSTDAAVKYGPDAIYARGAVGTPCFFSRQNIEYDQGAGGQALIYRTHFWVYLSGAGQLNFKESYTEYDNQSWGDVYEGPNDYPLPLSSQNTPTWIYEYFTWATSNPPRSYGEAMPWSSGGYIKLRDQAGDIIDSVHHAGWHTNLTSSWQWQHLATVHQYC